MKNVLISVFLLTLFFLATGCGEGKSGVVLRVTTDTAGIAPVEKLRLATTGDGTDDVLADRNLTPSSFTVAFTSFRLLEEADPDNPNTPIDSHTVFERSLSDPIEISLTSGQTIEVDENTREPSQGTYDRLEYGVRYFEMTIPFCRLNDDCEERRVRYYLSSETDPLLNFTPTAGDILISGSRTGDDFNWISTSAGIPLGLVPIGGQRPADAYQLPPGILSPTGATDPAIFSEQISPPLEIDSNPEVVFVFTLHFDLSGLFFFDNTDEDIFDPAPDVHFNALLNDLDETRDGKISLECVNPATCRADFWPGFPPITVTRDEEERDD
ncbi:MAG: hypothetical protein MPW16_04415 [Candidatus Manganitrophus sp.]|nr:MAG: hypothetical protein MPW16_04415 [Candidatus Manganitrophus sp.]